MSEHVQTCLNLFRFNMIRIVTIHTILKHVWTCWNMSKIVQVQYDMNWYILKHVKTQNENMTKYAKFEQMAHEMLLTEDKAIPRIASSKSSDQK